MTKASPLKQNYEVVAKRLRDEIVSIIDAPRGSGLADAEAVARSAAVEATKLGAELAAQKAAANALKAEIADWKAWWEGLPADRAVDEIPKRQLEITRCATRLAKIEEQIAALDLEHKRRAGVASALRLRAEAIAAHGPQGDEEFRARLLIPSDSAPSPPKPPRKRTGVKKADALVRPTKPVKRSLPRKHS